MDVPARDQVIKAVHETAKACGAEKAILFGSFARGTATRHSDVDAVFVETTDQRFIERLDRYMAGIYDRLGIPAEVFVYTPEEFANMRDQPFMKRILNEGVPVYER